MNGKFSFPPIVDQNARILLLGTMPGERSIRMQQYYGHSGNQFWKILLRNNIALWDVLQYCEGKGSADSAIRNEVPNDFSSFFYSNPKIKHIFLTSKKANAFYDKYIGKSSEKEYYLLPSPSRANTWKNFEKKLEDWKIILQYL